MPPFVLHGSLYASIIEQNHTEPRQGINLFYAEINIRSSWRGICSASFFTAAEYAGKVACTVEAALFGNQLDGERRTGQQNLCVTQTLLLQIIMRTEADVPGKAANEVRYADIAQIGKCFECDLFPEVLGNILDRRANYLGDIRFGVRHRSAAA